MDEKKLRVYTTAVSIAGLSVFLLSLWEVYPYYLPGSSRGDIWSYSLMMVLLMVVCRMLPIYFAEDKTLEISFVPVLACAITGGAALAVAGMVAARVLAPNTGASIAPGVIALALLFWDFTRERRLMTAVSRFVREKILEEQAQ